MIGCRSTSDKQSRQVTIHTWALGGHGAHQHGEAKQLYSCGNDAPIQLLKRMNRLPGNCRAGLLAYGYGLNETALRLAWRWSMDSWRQRTYAF